jgi:beta-lactamase superfamily II metal-dependent hydrolase
LTYSLINLITVVKLQMGHQKPVLFILDVGHGNSAVLVDTKGTLVIDAGRGNSLYLFLKQERITNLDVILISHADDDHIAGLMGIIASEEFAIGKVRVNSDASKGSKVWDDLLYALSKAVTHNKIGFDVSLSTKDTGKFNQGQIHIEILAPNLYIAGKSPGGNDRQGRPLTSNSISSVIRMCKSEMPFALFLGDIDTTGFENLLEDTKDVSSMLAVFPHHGGKPGRTGDPVSFTQKVCESVNPKIIVFSNGRGEHSTPRKEITQTIRKVLLKTRIMCTQLSESCAADILPQGSSHLTYKFAKGREKGKCCAGTIVLNLGKDKISIYPDEKGHLAFIKKAAPTALCIGD